MPISVVCLSFLFEANVLYWDQVDINVLLPFNQEQKCSNWTKNNYGNTFYPLFDAQFVNNRKTISFGPCNIMIAQQNLDVILSMCNIYKQFYIVTHPIHNCNLNILLQEYCCLKQNKLYRWEEDHFWLIMKYSLNLKKSSFYKDPG